MKQYLATCPHTREIKREIGDFVTEGNKSYFRVDKVTTEIVPCGERNYVIRKILSAKDGYSRRDDVLPKRLREPLKKGICEGEDIPEELLSKVIDEYYLLRGFNDYGPTNERLKELGLINILK